MLGGTLYDLFITPNNNASVKIDKNNLIFKFNDWTDGDIKELHSFFVSHFNKRQQIKTLIVDVENLFKKKIKIHGDDLEYAQKISEILSLAGRELLILVPCSASNQFNSIMLSTKETGLKHILCASSIDQANKIVNSFKDPDFINSPEYKLFSFPFLT